MAKVVYSPQVGDMRNKTGGAVHTKTRFGSMVRRKVSPIQPRSAAQMNVRADFTALSKLWSDTTMDNYRAAWIALAQQYPVKDVFGAAHNLTGLQMFVRLNRALHTIAVATILPPPATLSVPYPGALTLAKEGGPPITSLTVDLATPPTAAEKGVIFATPPQSPGRATAGAKFRKIKIINSLTTLPTDILPEYITKFGAPPTGRQVFVQVLFTNLTTGAQSLPSEAAITV